MGVAARSGHGAAGARIGPFVPRREAAKTPGSERSMAKRLRPRDQRSRCGADSPERAKSSWASRAERLRGKEARGGNGTQGEGGRNAHGRACRQTEARTASAHGRRGNFPPGGGEEIHGEARAPPCGDERKERQKREKKVSVPILQWACPLPLADSYSYFVACTFTDDTHVS